MSVQNYALGQLNPVVYFINSRGEVSLPPTTEDALRIKDQMRKRGYEFREAGTLAEIDRLQQHLQDQELRNKERALESNERIYAHARATVRARLLARMVSSETTPYERDFIKAYLMLRDEKREEYRKRFLADTAAYFVQRNFDNPRQQLQRVADSVPEGKDVECVQCHRFRRIKGSQHCFRCYYNIPGDLKL